MNSKLFKTSSLLLAGMIVFSACGEDEVIIYGDVVGTWNLSALTGTYERKVVSGSGIEHSADAYLLVASWDDAAGFAAATGGDAAVVTGATNQTLAGWVAGDNAPGFPRTNVLDAASLAALGIVMKGVFDDAPSKDKPGTYKITGTYPSIRLNTETCTPYLTVPQINDQGDYTLNFDTGVITLAPATDLDQVLPPFPDGKFTVDGDAGSMTIDFLDRDSHSSRYSEVMAAWSEADDRVISGISQLPVNTAGGFFTTPDDPGAGEDLSSSAYIASSALAAWGGYLTWYAFNINAETAVKVGDVKNPLTDLDGDGTITPVDMIVYMHADNLAGGGTVSTFGIPYAMLVDSSDPTAPAPVNDSATDFALAGLATASGGKMKYTILNGLCIPVDETIDFKSGWTSAD
ncbi:MAG: hypothetical protein ISR82_03180 [Candidatus Marinimicrobia bacterium]|nr:hypothetical protein [Candidatus Neomarinimicrobiota bacterium]MBL7010205.1 hypothetical protein [Candidatus Neomarinimicrobiota bacterium]MBL7030618.1 hypothetical protein [Candidatus Neomarinimicrobiota bacterium]